MGFSQQIGFLSFLLFMPPMALEMLGFDWKSTELCTYFMGFCLGIVFGWCLP